MGNSAHTTHNTKNPLFLGDENIFQKSARVVPHGIAIEIIPRKPIFKKRSQLREKGGGADAFENKPSFRSKGTVLRSTSNCRLYIVLYL